MTDPKTIYTVGGTVQAGGGIYIERAADKELLELCREGELAFILSSRQVGKSSLMVRTAEDLKKENIRSVIIDLSAIGVNITPDEWYLGILNEIATTLELETDIFAWWSKHAGLSPAQRLSNFFRDVLLKEIDERVVLFFDEIDSTLSIKFSDDFFAALRAVHNARSTTPDFARLSFVLLGVATPGDLISDSKRTPFNIGRRVDLTDFTPEEAAPLAQGLGKNAEQVLVWVFDWTGGHPYLTQRLCARLAKSPLVAPGAVPAAEESAQNGYGDGSLLVAETVENLFLGEEGRNDNNLQFVRDMLTKRAPDVRKVLKTYRDIRSGKEPVPDDERSLAKAHLKISGVVRRESEVLVPRNRVYKRVFDLAWIKENMPSPVPQRIAIASVLVALVAVLIAGYFGYQEFTRTDAERAARYTANFETAQTAQARLESLVDLYSLGESSYEMLALNLFNNLPVDERMAIFEPSSSRRVRNLQYELADEIYYYMGDTDENNAVLAAISQAMGEPKLYIREEIEPWLDGRDSLRQENFSAAEDLLNEANRANRDNPGVLVDRARAYIGQGPVYYPSALKDLEEVIVLTQENSLLPIWTNVVRSLLAASPDLRAHWELFQADYPVLSEVIIYPEVLIPAGEFLMGSNADEALAECLKYRDDCQLDYFTDEEPPHPVELAAFYIDQFEVTNARYAECVAAGACSPPVNSGSYTRDIYYNTSEFADYPVVYVSWFDANTYCEWRGARLPTEAEWEKAARGTDGRTYPWGYEFDGSLANFCDGNCLFDWANTDFDDGHDDTSPVGSYPDGTSPYGVHDMAGNVWEWTADWYAEDYYQNSPYSDPTGPDEGQNRVLRGGSWGSSGDDLRTSNRNYYDPSLTSLDVGFRCARSLP